MGGGGGGGGCGWGGGGGGGGGGLGRVISGHQEFFSSNLVGRIFFPLFFPISILLHFFSKSPTPPPPVKS